MCLDHAIGLMNKGTKFNNLSSELLINQSYPPHPQKNSLLFPNSPVWTNPKCCSHLDSFSLSYQSISKTLEMHPEFVLSLPLQLA
jgi:hypothetical protein